MAKEMPEQSRALLFKILRKNTFHKSTLIRKADFLAPKQNESISGKCIFHAQILTKEICKPPGKRRNIISEKMSDMQ